MGKVRGYSYSIITYDCKAALTFQAGVDTAWWCQSICDPKCVDLHGVQSAFTLRNITITHCLGATPCLSWLGVWWVGGLGLSWVLELTARPIHPMLVL